MDTADAPNATLVDTEQHIMRARSNGKDYLVQVALPHGYRRSTASFDVIVAPDANMSFGMYAGLTQSLPIMGEGRPVIFVAVGYPVHDISEAVNDRQDDLMPVTEPVPMEMRALSGRESVGGGAEAFRQFLIGELRAFVSDRYRVNGKTTTLFGHSTGGTLAVDTLFKAPTTFDQYIIVSPWLSMGGDVGLRMEKEYADNHDDLPARVFLCAGALEDGQALISGMRVAQDTRQLGERLSSRRYPSLELHVREFADEAHVSGLARGLAHGFRALFGEGTPADRQIAFPEL